MKGVAAVLGKRRVLERLAPIGVGPVSGADGANIEDAQRGALAVRHHRGAAKHEFSAATMANGYSRGRVGLGVVSATFGGGVLNPGAALRTSLISGGSGACAGWSRSVMGSGLARHRRGEATAAETLYK